VFPTRSTRVFSLSLLFAVLLVAFCILPSMAAPPVRLAVVPGGGSGMEQEVCDRISDQLQSNNSVKVSTVNPDWFAVVSITDKPDLVGQTVRVNGTVTIKTTDGHIIDTISVQTNKQDFNLTPGTPAPMNKALVDSAVREVIEKLAGRAINPITDAVETEMQTRAKIIEANTLADDDKYDAALKLLMQITPATPHFKGARELIAEYQMEQDALDLMNQANGNVRAGKYRSAIQELMAINHRSKRAAAARQMIATLQRGSGARRPSVSKTITSSKNPATDQLKALEAQKKALDAQKRAIEAQETAIKGRNAPNK
jgi:hypothetical protein